MYNKLINDARSLKVYFLKHNNNNQSKYQSVKVKKKNRNETNKKIIDFNKERIKSDET